MGPILLKSTVLFRYIRLPGLVYFSRAVYSPFNPLQLKRQVNILSVDKMEKYSDLNFGNPKRVPVIEFRVAQGEETLTSRTTTGKRRYDEYLLGLNINQTLVFGQRAPTPRWPHYPS